MGIFDTYTFLTFSSSDSISSAFFQEVSDLGTKLLVSLLGKNLVLGPKLNKNSRNHQRTAA